MSASVAAAAGESVAERALLADGRHGATRTFPASRVRYLRLAPAVAGSRPWTIAEIECFE